MKGNSVFLSVVVPILDENGNLVELHKRLTVVLTHLNRPYEIVFVDDGSSDGSVQICKDLVESYPNVSLVELRRNFGKATALQAGFEVARGDVIVTMDGDLQDEPEEIPRFLAALEEGFDLVSGWKKIRQDPITKRVASRIFNFVTSVLTKVPLRDFNCGFKIYRRVVVEQLNLYGEMHRYIPAIVHAKGFRVGEIAVRHHPRSTGKSKYHFERYLRGAFDLLTVLFLSSFQRRPLHLFGLVGLLFVALGTAINSYLSILWFMGEVIGRRPLLLLGCLLIMLGIQVLIFGLLGEMITAASFRRSEVMDLVRQVHRGSGDRAHRIFSGS